ncbi:GNAT family N-acetyltransferase [Streptomyces sp.]|uniref:GNAT family N-acetyltransferase n=1 Tax=Streptomyces sp. TaxID=1931 RepID=UPI002D3B4A61|nr:GNAT family N-acetyltransferase [Streptomyces sp.]HZF90576.1 GNAT family N-acetyltransferase [Streptomyces sp.]
MALRIKVRDFVPEDEPGVLELFAACEDWFVAATGQPSGPGDVQSMYYALPPGCAPERKRLLVLEAEGRVTGLVDAVLGHPDPQSCAVGCWLLAPHWRRRGIGGAVARALLSAAPAVRRVTAVLPPGWAPGTAFARATGFRVAGAPGVSVGDRNAGPVERAALRAELDVRSFRAGDRGVVVDRTGVSGPTAG